MDCHRRKTPQRVNVLNTALAVRSATHLVKREVSGKEGIWSAES